MRLYRCLSLLILTLSANGADAQQAIIILRHAEQTLVGGMMDGDPELNEIGRARAQSYSVALKDASVERIYSSQYARARQTAEPLASLVQKEVTVVAKDDLDGLVSQIKGGGESGGAVVVVAHSDTIPKLLALLGHVSPVEVGRTEFNSLWFVVPRASGPPLVSRIRL